MMITMGGISFDLIWGKCAGEKSCLSPGVVGLLTGIDYTGKQIGALREVKWDLEMPIAVKGSGTMQRR